MFGVRAETTGSGTVTLSGSGHSAGFGVTKASGAAKWPTGIYIEGGAVVEAIQIGVKSSSNGNGIVLNDTAVDGSGITRAVGVFSEIGASLPTAGIDTVAVESRLLVALDMSSRTGNSIKASRGHLRIAGGKLAAAAESCGLSGYIEISGTSAIGVGGINAAISATVEASGTVTGAANDILAGVCVSGTNLTLGTARSTAFQVYAGSLFTSLLDVGGGCSFVVGSDGSGAYQYLYVYINNTRHRIACRAD